jgi:hypothetical protein
MDDQLAAAAAAYHRATSAEVKAKQRLRDARRDKAAATAAVELARRPLAEAIVTAAQSGMRQRDILVATNWTYTRERVRQICRAAGIEPQG